MTLFDQVIETLGTRFPLNGHFTFRAGENLRACARSARIPTVPGVYLVYGEKAGAHECLYVGLAGTMCQDGSFGDQMLPQRLWMKQDGLYRQQVWTERLQTQGLDALVIRWFATFHGDRRILPSKAEADLLQAYFDEYQCLPAWNKKA